MDPENDPGSPEVWERRWARTGRRGGATPVARLMFRSKGRALRKVLSRIRPATMIEVGCGLGYTGKVFRDAGLDYFGIDASPTAVALCRSRGLNVEQKELENVAGVFDLVASDGLLEHSLNFELPALQMMRLSRNYVLLIQPNHDSPTGKTLAFFAEIFRGRTNVHEYNYRIGDFIRTFERHGFRLIESVPVFLNVFRLLLFEKIT